jgi:hypothetical protein
MHAASSSSHCLTSLYFFFFFFFVIITYSLPYHDSYRRSDVTITQIGFSVAVPILGPFYIKSQQANHDFDRSGLPVLAEVSRM